jgi:hypothetical protein
VKGGDVWHLFENLNIIIVLPLSRETALCFVRHYDNELWRQNSETHKTFVYCVVSGLFFTIPKTYKGRASEIFSANLYGMRKRVLGTVKVTSVRRLLYL